MIFIRLILPTPPTIYMATQTAVKSSNPIFIPIKEVIRSGNLPADAPYEKYQLAIVNKKVICPNCKSEGYKIVKDFIRLNRARGSFSETKERIPIGGICSNCYAYNC